MISSIQESVKSINSQLITHREQISFQESLVESGNKKIEQVLIQAEDLKANMVMKSNYLKEIDIIQEDTKRAMFSIEDVSKNLDATDNYLEKYFPVKMQELINETLKILCKTDQEKEAILDYEIKKYKDFHKVVMNDDGSPALEKKMYRFPSIKELELNLNDIKLKNRLSKEMH